MRYLYSSGRGQVQPIESFSKELLGHQKRAGPSNKCVEWDIRDHCQEGMSLVKSELASRKNHLLLGLLGAKDATNGAPDLTRLYE